MNTTDTTTETPAPATSPTTSPATPTARERHQAMLEEHKEAKALRRERHRKHWHRIRVIPIQLV